MAGSGRLDPAVTLSSIRDTGSPSSTGLIKDIKWLQTFTLNEEMSMMLEICLKLKVTHKIEIYSQGTGYEKMFLISDPFRNPNWIAIPSLSTLVNVVAERKLGRDK